MSGIQFEEKNYSNSTQYVTDQSKGMTGLIIQLGLAKNKKQANIILIASLLLFLMISFFAISSTGGEAELSPTNPALIDPVL